MSITLRIMLLVMSVLTAFWILGKIRRCRVKQEDAVFWVCFAVILAVMGVFPQIVYWGAGVLGIQSPANFVFLAIIFLLLVKLLSLSIKVSMLESKLEIMAKEQALRDDGQDGEQEK